MRLPASALVLVVTACGAGAQSAPRVTQVSAQQPSVRTLVARRERAALREARRLVREFVPPPAARRDPDPGDHGGVLRQSGPGPFGETAAAHRFWRVRKPLAAVIAFLRTSDPPGFRRMGATYGSRPPHYLMRTLAWPASGRRAPSRYLNETIATLPGRTVIRVEAKVLWVYPRSPRERVPAATSEIVVRAPKVSTKVTDPAEVAVVARWLDALPVSPPGIPIACPLILAARATLTFRSAAGERLATASVPLTSSSVCDPIGFAIGGRRQKPLVDRAVGESFVRRLQHQLGVRLVRKRH